MTLEDSTGKLIARPDTTQNIPPFIVPSEQNPLMGWIPRLILEEIE